MSLAYEPSRTLSAKISRRVTPLLSRRVLPLALERPIVSFTFDDCPASAITNGVKPLEDEGWASTVYVAGGLLGTTNHHGLQITEKDMQALHADGHEIGGHTWSHIDAQSMNPDAFLEDILRNQNFMTRLGLPASRSFAYPYGQTIPALKRLLEIRFEGMRGITPGVHRKNVDLNQIKSTPLFGGSTIDSAHKMIAGLKRKPGWITLFTHDIRENHTPWGCSPKDFQGIIEAVKTSGADVMPVDKAIDFIRSPS